MSCYSSWKYSGLAWIIPLELTHSQPRIFEHSAYDDTFIPHCITRDLPLLASEFYNIYNKYYIIVYSIVNILIIKCLIIK